jgi:ribosomal protein S18 acetylase RimI-like enzyme
VADGLRWLRRWGAREVLVNTQEGNEAAVALYERLGFRRHDEGLAVLQRPLAGPAR